MNLLILRIIPYLYYFIKEQYRADVEGRPPTKKQRTKYRTIISILTLFIIIAGMYLGYNKYVDRNMVCVDERKAETYPASVSVVSRETYEKDVRLLIRESVEKDFMVDSLKAEITKLCEKHPTECSENTHHMIDQSNKVNPNGK
ncbi:hypothetical protein TOTORO_02420 [Serratia phage vB_SmaS-Totoro]|nr:hypothetical protein TOTORO_02420 [Serratia phage vB_SmaS-Totoro]